MLVIKLLFVYMSHLPASPYPILRTRRNIKISKSLYHSWNKFHIRRETIECPLYISLNYQPRNKHRKHMELWIEQRQKVTIDTLVRLKAWQVVFFSINASKVETCLWNKKRLTSYKCTLVQIRPTWADRTTIYLYSVSETLWIFCAAFYVIAFVYLSWVSSK